MSRTVDIEEAIRLEGKVAEAERIACVEVLAELSTARLKDLYRYYTEKTYFEDGETDLSVAIEQVFRSRHVKFERRRRG